MSARRFRHYIHNKVFKIKHKLYIASRSAPFSPQKKIGCAYDYVPCIWFYRYKHNSRWLVRFQVITEVLKKCLPFGLERRSDWYIGDDVSKERQRGSLTDIGTAILRNVGNYLPVDTAVTSQKTWTWNLSRRVWKFTALYVHAYIRTKLLQ